MGKQAIWIVHGGSDSYFAARSYEDAFEVVTEMNKISLEYGMPPTSKVEIGDDYNYWKEELIERDEVGDDEYFQP